MFDRRFMLEATALIVAAVVVACVANLVAAPERKVAFVGDYPNWAEVPERNVPAGEDPVVPAEVASSPGEALDFAELVQRYPSSPDRPFVEVGGEDAVTLHASGAAFLDARRSQVFAEGHIAGALSFPVWESAVLEPRVVDLAGQLLDGRVDGEAPIVIYCSGGNCEDSHMLAERLYQVGFNNLLVYRDGFPDWQQRGGAVSAGIEG